MWPFSKQDKEYIIELRKKIYILEDEIDNLEKHNRQLKKITDSIDESIKLLEQDFNFDSVYKIISMEFLRIENSSLLRCVICYMLIEPVIAEGNIKTEPVYKEWYCICTVEQYQKLYNKYLVYKKEVYKHE